MYRRRINDAVTWQIVSEICRRHLDREDLVLMETHPGDGQYDCLSVFKRDRGDLAELASFNLNSANCYLSKWIATGEKPHGQQYTDFVGKYLKATDPKIAIDAIQKAMGLHTGERLPPSSPPVLTIRLIAQLYAQLAFQSSGISATNCWHDSSGMEGSFGGFPKWAIESGEIRLPANSKGSRIGMLEASEYWTLQLSEDTKNRPLALVHISGTCYLPGEKVGSWNFWEDYQSNGHRLGPIACNLIERLCKHEC